MHFVLEALAVLSQKYPDAILTVAGNSVIEHRTVKEKIKLPAYGKYLLSLIKKYKLENKVILAGKLNAEEMKQQFLKSSVFVCASVLENSPNTVGEAQLLGVPAAASNAGGIPDLIEDGKNGLLFPTGDVAAMAEKIEALWDRRKDENGRCLAERISMKAAERARITHDGEANYLRLLEIYKMIGERE
jgi:glycosyltransferase involved in cell wall biosynthesis